MFNSSNLSIALSNEDVFVQPRLSNENPILKGTIHLKLSQKRALKSLEVHLIGLSVIEGEEIDITPPPLVEFDSNEEWSFERICRVGSDDHIRATTLEETETKIRISHKLIVEIRYRDGSSGKKTDKILTLSKEVTIASCCTHLDSVQLPFYSKTDPHAVRKPLETKCRCNTSLQRMLDEDGKMLERAGSNDKVFTMSRSHSKEE